MSAVTSAPFFDLAAPPVAEPWLGAWENSADCAYCRDATGRILAANVSFARKFGLASAALEAASITDFIHTDDLPAVAASNT